MNPAAATGPGRVLSARLGGVPAVIVAAIASAWALALVAQASGGSAVLSHDSLLSDGPPPAGAVALFLVAWQVMIAAMMLPSSLPLVAMFSRASQSQPRPSRALAAFLGGYAAVWSAFGAAALVGDGGIHALVEAWPWLESHSGLVLGSTLAVAGAFQFSSLKDKCLDKCRHPAMFMLRHYRRGAGGGFRLGLRHGAFCLGCCWALMLVAFAVGTSSLPWMAAFAAIMYWEKTRPSGARAVPVTGAMLLGTSSILVAWSLYAAV
jgi:predicted metal-binding membrane protein